MEVFFTILICFLLGALIIYPTFPVFLRKKWIILGIIICALSGFLALLLGSVIHPVGVVFTLYIIGIILHFIGPKRWSRSRTWERVFKLGFLFIGVIYCYVFIVSLFFHSGRARQSEAKENLAWIATCEIAYFAENGSYSASFKEIGWHPEGKIKYSFFLSDKPENDRFYISGVYPDGKRSGWVRKNDLLDFGSYIRYKKSIGDESNYLFSLLQPTLEQTAREYGIGVSPDGFTAIAIGNIDADPELDIWIINQKKDPRNIINDVNIGYGSTDMNGLDLYFVKIYDDGFEILLDRLAAMLFLLNFLLWLGLRYLNLKSPSSARL